MFPTVTRPYFSFGLCSITINAKRTTASRSDERPSATRNQHALILIISAYLSNWLKRHLIRNTMYLYLKPYLLHAFSIAWKFKHPFQLTLGFCVRHRQAR